VSSLKSNLPCPIQKTCGICPYVNQDYSTSLAKKYSEELQWIKRAGLLPPSALLRPISSPRKLGYRTIFKLAVRAHPNPKAQRKFCLGLFQPGSHSIGPDLTACPLHSAPLRKFLRTLSPLLEDSSLSPYNEEKQTGDLRYLIGRTNQEGSELMITWVVTRPLENILKSLTHQLVQLGLPVKVSAMNLNPHHSNAIWGKETILLTPYATVSEQLNGFHFQMGPSSFFQVNPWQTENIYLRIEKIAREFKDKSLAWDLYSGVGTISCVLAKHFKKVFAFEENTEASQLIQINAKENKCFNQIEVHQGLAEVSLSHNQSNLGAPSLIVVNPSRRGIEESARQKLANVLRASPSSQLVYLSCNVKTLVRDLLDFREKGIQAFQGQAFDMHAQTGQLEWLIQLQPNSQSK